MNRNVESHFSQLPGVQIQRSTFDRSSSYKTAFNAGELIPFYVDEVLPGDTFDITTAKVVRSQTMLTPVMDNMFLDTYWFYVPNRLVWQHWKEFCGENTRGAWAPSVEYSIPKIHAPVDGFEVGTLADYMGLPVGVDWNASYELAPSALPFRGYALICNEFFRDQNVSDPLLIPLDDANQEGTNEGNYITDVANGGKPFKVAKYHDLYTSCLPAPQKGDPVGVPVTVGSPLPVGVFPFQTYKADKTVPMLFGTTDYHTVSKPGGYDIIPEGVNMTTAWSSPLAFTTNLSNGIYGRDVQELPPETSNTGHAFYPLNLGVTSGDAGGELSFKINELRLAFAYQRFLEAIARSGSRYAELCLGLFGVRSPDARLQRPEYLGGNRVPINVNEVTSTTQSAQVDLGELGAKSQTGDVNHDFIKSFTEHGYLFGLMCVRYDHSYSQGIPKFWTRSTFTDFYNPKFANLGEVPVYQAEIFATPGNMRTKDQIFGYQEIWCDYRYRPNYITGRLRPGVESSLAHWHLGDYYTEPPTLSDAWMREDPVNVDRVLAVTSAVSEQFWCDIYIKNKCTRCMPMYSVPGLIDHF